MGITNRQRRHQEAQLREAEWCDSSIERIIRENDLTSYMSDSKWIRLFDAASARLPPETRCEWRFLADERTWQTSLPDGADVAEGHYECMHGVFVLKHVESVILHVDDPSSLSHTLAKSGDFFTHSVDAGLQIFGYR